MAPDADRRVCVEPSCSDVEIITESGTCVACDDYTAPDADIRTCVEPSCSDG